jgi:hypothetical protein
MEGQKEFRKEKLEESATMVKGNSCDKVQYLYGVIKWGVKCPTRVRETKGKRRHYFKNPRNRGGGRLKFKNLELKARPRESKPRFDESASS